MAPRRILLEFEKPLVDLEEQIEQIRQLARDSEVDVSQQLQQLDAMSEQLEAVTSCMRVEQQARVAAEAQLAEAREQMQGLLKHLNETEKARKEEAQTMSALRGLLEQIQCENQGLKEQNASLVSQCRTLSGREAKQEDLKPEPPQARGRPVPKRG